MARRLTALRALSVLLALASVGCETLTPATCDPWAQTEPTLFTGGGVVDGVYTSALPSADTGLCGASTSAWDAERLWFPGGMRYDLEHQLGASPKWIESFLSFDRCGTIDGGVLAQPAGNQVEIERVDDEHIRVHNNSCVDYWLLVIAGLRRP